MIITIDGPTASGKSTVAKMLAQKLGFVHLNSGLLYRALAYVLVHKFHYSEKQLADPQQTDLDQIVQSGKLVYKYVNNHAQVLYDGLDITQELKTKDMDNYSSISSADPKVRAALMAIQRAVGLQNNVVAEGRDTGTKVFPQADSKIFLTASLAVRAHRWQAFMHAQGKDYSLEQSAELINERDARDINRKVAPLVPAADAVVVDNSALTSEQVVEVVCDLLKKKSKLFF